MSSTIFVGLQSLAIHLTVAVSHTISQTNLEFVIERTRTLEVTKANSQNVVLRPAYKNTSLDSIEVSGFNANAD